MRPGQGRSRPALRQRYAWPSRAFALALALGLASWLACAPEPPTRIVWIVLDATRADAVGAYGNRLDTTPNIDRFAEHATVFERAYSQSAWTPASVASYLTGRYPSLAMQALGPGRISPGQSIAVALRAAGLRTAAFTENPFVTATFGYDDGFEHFESFFSHASLEEQGLTFERVDSGKTVQAATDWLDAHPQDPFLLYVHLLPPHVPYDPPEPFAGRFDQGYDGDLGVQAADLVAVNRGERKIDARDLRHLRRKYQENLAYADHQVGRLLDHLEKLGFLEDALVIVGSDHGEAFFEHGILLHGHSVYTEVLHVPLIVRFPARFGTTPSRFDGVVELRQIAPTVCRAARVAACAETGPDLLESLRSDRAHEKLALAYSMDARQRPMSTAIGQRFKLIAFQDARRLVDFDADPRERRNVARAHPREFRRLAAALRAPSGARLGVIREEIPDALRAGLEALGYVDMPGSSDTR